MIVVVEDFYLVANSAGISWREKNIFYIYSYAMWQAAMIGKEFSVKFTIQFTTPSPPPPLQA